MDLNFIQTIVIYALPVIFAITLHEAAHGYVAKHFGDTTAYMLGRVSLNPIRHIDPIGTIVVPIVTLLLGGILFGWAKPVPVNFGQLRRPKQDMLWVAIAGPAANLAMAIFWGLIIKLGTLMPETYYTLPLVRMGQAGVMINVVLMVLNLLPLPPLDGGRVAVSLLPNSLAYRFSRIEPYGLIILVILFVTHILGQILWPVVNVTLNVLSFILGF
ncbi:MAG TPA: site-2 protease family protein [Burkholderiales bacterium]|jgi:Zn-dependent protease|nr:site-2 protease family protein [Burkholderiales bacterium]